MKLTIATNKDKHEVDLTIGSHLELTNKGEKHITALIAYEQKDHLIIVFNPPKKLTDKVETGILKYKTQI